MPFNSQLHVDQLLSNVSVKYTNAEYIAMKVFPEVPVKTDTNKYRIYDRDWRIPDTLRANKGVANQRYFEVSTATYVLEDHAIKDYISQDDVDNYDQASLEVDTTEDLTDVILRRLEKSVADLFTKTSWSLTVSMASANLWSAETTVSNPILVVDTGATTVLNNAGLKPNYMILPRQGFVYAKNHPSVLDRIKYTQGPQGDDASKSMLAGLFGVQELLVPAASYDQAHKGYGPSIASIWPSHAFLGYKPAQASPKAPSAGYIFRKQVPQVRKWDDNERNCTAIEVRMKFQARIVASLSGYLITGIY
jgi:hypothetical protein